MDQMRIEHEISEVVTRYFRGVDRADWELVRSCYHADAVDHHGTFEGTRDLYIDFATELTARYTAMNHCKLNHLVMIDSPTTAASETYALCFHLLPREGDDLLETYMVRYLDRFEFRDGEWRIADRMVLSDWSCTSAIPRRSGGSAASRGRRTAADPSFALLPFGLGLVRSNAVTPAE